MVNINFEHNLEFEMKTLGKKLNGISGIAGTTSETKIYDSSKIPRRLGSSSSSSRGGFGGARNPFARQQTKICTNRYGQKMICG